MDSVSDMDRIETKDERRRFLMNLICFATCIEGLFFFAAFAYVYFLRSKEEPDLFDDTMNQRITEMLEEAVDVEFAFAEDVLSEGVTGMSLADTRTYLEFVADQRLMQLGLAPRFNAKNPFGFMELQDVQQLSNFFERTVSAYQIGVEGDVGFDDDF